MYGRLLLLSNLFQQGHSFSRLPKLIKVISDNSSPLDKQTVTEAVMSRFDALADSIPKALEHIKKAQHRHREAYVKKRKYAISSETSEADSSANNFKKAKPLDESTTDAIPPGDAELGEETTLVASCGYE